FSYTINNTVISLSKDFTLSNQLWICIGVESILYQASTCFISNEKSVSKSLIIFLLENQFERF
ncbi:TPA: hypothetical protein ACWLYL_002778, partial [Staphylococcus aureus]